MFLVMLLVTLGISLLTAALTAYFFDHAIDRVLTRIVGDDLAGAWHKYIRFAIVVVGVSGGVQLWELQKYVGGKGDSATPPAMNLMSWTLEVYRSVIETLQSIAWMLLLFFLCGMIATVVMRGMEARRKQGTPKD
jgi:hypothetical protein